MPNIFQKTEELIDDCGAEIEQILRGEAEKRLDRDELLAAERLIERALELAQLIADEAACALEDLLEKPHLALQALSAANAKIEER